MKTLEEKIKEQCLLACKKEATEKFKSAFETINGTSTTFVLADIKNKARTALEEMRDDWIERTSRKLYETCISEFAARMVEKQINSNNK